MAINWPTVVCEDKLIWMGNAEGKFSIKNCYLLNFAIEEESENLDSWSKLWRLDLHDHLKMFMWHLKKKVIPSKELVSERVRSGDRSCAICGAEVESYYHIFKECQGIKALAFASKWGCHLDFWTTSNMGEIIQHCIEPNRELCFQGMEEGLISVFLCTIFYVYLNYRNSYVHAPEKMDKMVIWFNFLVEELATKNEEPKKLDIVRITNIGATKKGFLVSTTKTVA